MTLLPAMIALAVAWLAILILLKLAAHLPQDRPNTRSLHAGSVPRVGGLAIWAGWLPATVWLSGAKPWLLPVLVVIGVSLLDDRRSVHPALRLSAQLAAAGLWIWLARPVIAPIIALVLIVWMANLYNFMDGSDGLAGAMALVGFGAYAIGAWAAGSPAATLLAALAVATVPFLVYNAPPARIFLGDAGSVPLGFLAAVFGITGWSEGWWPAWFPVLIFLPFIADASITLAKRLVRGARVWEPHREHGYQHLVQIGWGHARTLALYAGLMMGAAATGLSALVWAPEFGMPALALWAAVLGLGSVLIEYHWRRRGAGLEESKG